MSSRHHIDDFMRGRIIGKIEEGRKIAYVAREIDIAHSVVSRLWKSFETTGMCSRRHGKVVLEIRRLQKTDISSYQQKETGAPQLSRLNHWEVGGRPQCDKCGCRVRNCSQHRFTTLETISIHEEPHPQMTGKLSYRPEETGGRQREKLVDTRHRRLDDRYRVLPWPEDCTVVVCLHNALYGVYL
ncbi:hypothetical protein TNCV_1038981 [Trichonephila clavipes]|uniref:Uncharacterized protein n=1 Tax=Trichonephila clavipes TaxID=2585209 RepID=A0A8X7BA64_TRICX|nr:hypothetical protein TNCV_1038981 [Trichonephila clavipes]